MLAVQDPRGDVGGGVGGGVEGLCGVQFCGLLVTMGVGVTDPLLHVDGVVAPLEEGADFAAAARLAQHPEQPGHGAEGADYLHCGVENFE